MRLRGVAYDREIAVAKLQPNNGNLGGVLMRSADYTLTKLQRHT
jgi:hypothetical protein